MSTSLFVRFVAAPAVMIALVGLLLCGVAGPARATDGAAGAQYANGGTSVGNVSAAAGRVQEQDKALSRTIDEISSVGARLQDSQSQLESARKRSEKLQSKSRNLRKELALRRAESEASRKAYERGAVAAYRGSGVEQMGLALDSVLGGGKVSGADLSRLVFDGRNTLEQYKASEQSLVNTEHQISQTNGEYRKVVEDQQRQDAALKARREQLQSSAAKIRQDKEYSRILLQKLQANQRQEIQRQSPATGGPSEQRGYELQVARRGIVAEKVGPISKKRYFKLYKKAAKQYGFAKDWEILAAVGKIESNHGENMGPSSAGALGPMQFLPSTWKSAGVDGNGDGRANIMDPADAIPAAARYLKAGGAPQDWYAALYSYNHADWYVTKVLAVAEGYRQLAREGRALK